MRDAGPPWVEAVFVEMPHILEILLVIEDISLSTVIGSRLHLFGFCLYW